MIEEKNKAIEDLRKILFQTIQANECGLSTNDFKDEIKTYTDILNLIEKLQKEKDKILNSKVGVDLSFDDYIPKDKIREKIEDLRRKIENNKNNWHEYFYDDMVEYSIKLLKELLEEVE